ncbi:MAG: hypothetical protein ACRDYB_13285 [Acidimicrobiales bacterium]
MSIDRAEITELLREVSGEPRTRIKSNLARLLTEELITQGIQVHPSLGETTTGDTVHLYHAGSLFGQVNDMFTHPDKGHDKNLGEVLTKIKGKWQWAPVEEPAPSTDDLEAHLLRTGSR